VKLLLDVVAVCCGTILVVEAEDVRISEWVKLLIGFVAVVATGEEVSGFGCQEAVPNNGLSSVSTLPLVALDDGEEHDEEWMKEAEVNAELGRKQTDGRIVGNGEGKIQLLDGFCPLNAGLSP
jgi:hypothetical protein